jgi:hypothetical protein
MCRLLQVVVGIRHLKICGEKLSVNDSAVPGFIQSFIQQMKDQDLRPKQIYNADKSMLVFKDVGDTTLVTIEEKTANGRKKSKEHITMIPCVNATGLHKLSIMVIGKSKNPKHKTTGNAIDNAKSSWQTQSLFKEWFFAFLTVLFQHQLRIYKIKICLPRQSFC